MRRMMEIDFARALGDGTRPLTGRMSLDPGRGHALAGGASGNGQYVEVPGDETPGFLGDVDGLMDEIEEFLVGTRVASAVDRRVATVLFSDVVGSTERAAAVGSGVERSAGESSRGVPPSADSIRR